MGWRGPSAQSEVPLKYKFLDAALARKKRGTLGMVQLSHSVQAVRSVEEKDTIRIMLHGNHIMTFFPNGNIAMFMAGWSTNLTRHWLYQAVPRYIEKKKPNKWTDHVWLYQGRHKFYDGMLVDGTDYELIDTPRPMWMNVPSAQAKELRKRILHQYDEVYLPHLRMLSLKGDGEERIPMQFAALPTLADFFQPKDEVKLVYDMCTSNPSTTHQWGDAIALFRDGMDRMYEKHVRLLKLFDAVPYQPKEK